MSPSLLSAILSPQSWPASIWALLLSGVATLAYQYLVRPSLPPKAPAFWKKDDVPFFGALRFFSARADFMNDALRSPSVGNDFSFYVGQKQVVALHSQEGRRTYFDNKDFNFGAGFGELFAGGPANSAKMEDFSTFFNKSLISLLKKENFVRNIHLLTSDTRAMCEALDTSPTYRSANGSDWRVFNPFDDMYRLVYQLTMRTVGATEIVEDPKMLSYTLGIFEAFERSTSNLRIIFPWLPTPKHLYRMYNGARLYMVFDKLVKERQRTGTKHEDALQFLIEQGADAQDIVSFELGALFAGQVNSGINASWIPLHLCLYPEWKAKVRAEIDAAIARHRTSASQSRYDVLDTLSLDAWESEFGLIDLSLRESIRLGIPGSSFRKNTTGADIPIGKTGGVVPDGAFATYLLDDVHMDPAIYSEPMRFDPGRYMPDRAEDKKIPHSYLGWGSGRHPCLGMKFAKLEMSLIIAYFVAEYDFELSDAQGNRTSEAPPPVDRNQNQAQKPSKTTYVRYRRRQD
ncbi:cytochrome P450 6A1 [Truncatella angustata]|uniref:Cytochrome P450 6A1 n=1 Tax=Truncatella angustata TaxID=152316 RepID=A0A9P8UQM8_9PEZI|nr:cytochrome P450 6A1 [Truncatella angustata]KAH6656578.1 cytochrome P450 6A1 [Truncatella angustata]